MKLSEICIRKPVLAIVISLVLVVLGFMAYSRLQIRFFPKFEMPVVKVHTTYTGASATIMENQVTTILENNIAGVDDIKYMTSSSSQGSSEINVYFPLGSDLQSEAAEVRDKVSASIKNLPTNIDPPTVTVGTHGRSLIYFAFFDKNKTPTEIREYLESSVTPLFNQVQGVGETDLIGGADYAMRIWLNPAKMASYGITVANIKSALYADNIYFSAGQVRGEDRLYSIVPNTQLKTPQQFANIILKHNASGTVRLKDVAKVDLGFSTFEETSMRINGINGVIMGIKPLETANAIQVAARVRQAFHKIQHKLPPGMHAKIVYDNSRFLHSSITETFVAIGEAIALVILVVYLFLGSWRAATVPIVTIPVSLIAVFALIKLLGFTINILSLLGLLLAIGLVVDDAIVMLENIHRHIEQGMKPLQAALKGSREIAFAVIAMTIVLAAVYAPIGFAQGISAELFKEFAFTLASAVCISGFIALTLSPMMCSKVLLPVRQENGFTHHLEKFFENLSNHYQKILNWVLDHRLYMVIVVIILAISGAVLYKIIPSQFIPKEDYGLVNIKLNSPFDATVAYNDKYVKKIGAKARKISAVENVVEETNDNSASVLLVLKPWGKRKLTSAEVAKEINPWLQQIPGEDANAQVPDIVNYGSQSSDMEINFMTAGNYRELVPLMQKLVAKLKLYPGLMNVQNNLKFNSEQYDITINRDLAAELGVSLQNIGDTVSAMMGGAHWTDVQSGNRSFPVMVQMQKKDFINPNAVKQLYVTATNNGKKTMVPLSNLIQLKPIISQGTLYHYNRLRSGMVSASLAPGYTESEALAYINQQLPKVTNAHVRVAFTGKAEEYLQSAGSMTVILLLSFVFIYLVLAAQFSSFIDPFIILLAVPLSLVGGLLSLWISGGTINLYSEIGLVTLVGMISKHGILITQFANELRSQGKSLREAIVGAATVRLRPILMTTAAMVFGSIPLALAAGPGSVGRRDIGWVIVGGLLIGTFFSLIVVPIAYSYISRLRSK